MTQDAQVVDLFLQDHGEDPFTKFNTPASPILFPVGERAVGWQMRDGSYQRTNTHKAIIRLNQRGDAAQLLNVVGSGYKLVHNRELFSAVEHAMMNEMTISSLHDVRVTDKVSGWGKVCYRQYVFPSIRCRLPDTRSDIAFRLIVQNGYGGSALRMHAGAIDFYCTNGMIRGDYTSAYRKHTKGLIVGDLGKNIRDALLQFANGQEEWQRWARTPTKFDKVVAFFEEIAQSAKMKENLIDQYARECDTRGQNMWAVYSALTYYSSHNDGQFSMRRTVAEMDNEAATMLTRELNVAKWTQADSWRALEDA